MLVEAELTVKVEPKIPPIGLGRQGCVTSVRGVPEINARERLITSTREVEELCLIMLQHQ